MPYFGKNHGAGVTAKRAIASLNTEFNEAIILQGPAFNALL